VFEPKQVTARRAKQNANQTHSSARPWEDLVCGLLIGMTEARLIHFGPQSVITE